ncbi:MAG: hypothetical protein K8F90_16950 [Hyphomicrobiales bacterium]|nr:hypothetical protein [Hyphomicrobiales bacterium]
MGRDITSASGGAPNAYLDRLYKLIPTELTAAYVAAASLIDPVNRSDDDLWMLPVAYGVLQVLVPVYMWRLQGVRDTTQLLVSSISFPIWAANVSSMLVTETFGFLNGVTLGIVLILWTLVIPVVVKGNQP